MCSGVFQTWFWFDRIVGSGDVDEASFTEYSGVEVVENEWNTPFPQFVNPVSTLANVGRSSDGTAIEKRKADVTVDVAVGQPSDGQTGMYFWGIIGHCFVYRPKVGLAWYPPGPVFRRAFVIHQIFLVVRLLTPVWDCQRVLLWWGRLNRCRRVAVQSATYCRACATPLTTSLGHLVWLFGTPPQWFQQRG